MLDYQKRMSQWSRDWWDDHLSDDPILAKKLKWHFLKPEYQHLNPRKLNRATVGVPIETLTPLP